MRCTFQPAIETSYHRVPQNTVRATHSILHALLGIRLIGALEWRDGLALVLVERGANHATESNLDLAVRLLLPR